MADGPEGDKVEEVEALRDGHAGVHGRTALHRSKQSG